MGGKIMKRIYIFDIWKGILIDNKNIFVKFLGIWFYSINY